MSIEKPEWIKTKIPDQKALQKMRNLLKDLALHTICENAACPNIGICYAHYTATFLILGNICTRNCRFCNVTKGNPLPPDPKEPNRVAEAVRRLGLKHVVITSVTRDDLKDFGANHFVRTIEEVKKLNPNIKVEVLIPDFQGSDECIRKIVDTSPDIIGHNLETIPRLYPSVRPKASYKTSLKVLEKIKKLNPNIFTKSGIMVGLGEKDEEIFQVMKDLRSANCDIFTVGQYLRPSKKHLEVREYVKPEKFEEYKEKAYQLGFLYVVSGPFVRSSFMASEFFKKI